MALHLVCAKLLLITRRLAEWGPFGAYMRGEMVMKMYEYKTASGEPLRNKEKHKMAYWAAKVMVV